MAERKLTTEETALLKRAWADYFGAESEWAAVPVDFVAGFRGAADFYSEREQALHEALTQARADVIRVLGAGFDSTRHELATRAIERIDAALSDRDLAKYRIEDVRVDTYSNEVEATIIVRHKPTGLRVKREIGRSESRGLARESALKELREKVESRR